MTQSEALRHWAARHIRTVRRPPSPTDEGDGTDAAPAQIDTAIALESLTLRHERSLSGHTQRVWGLALIDRPDGRLLLATASHDHTARIWDPDTGTCLHTLTHDTPVNGVGFGWDHHRRLVLATASDDHQAHLWVAELSLITPSRLEASTTPTSHEVGAAGDGLPIATSEVVTLGAAGMWAPLGTISDLITLTGPVPKTGVPVLHDPRLAALVDNLGFRRLRELHWPAPARAAFAALLFAGQPGLDGYRPPEDSGPRRQAAALGAALRTAHLAVPAPIDVAVLAASADAISPATVTLCQIIGPHAATVDPLLPLQLAHHTDHLPELTATGSTLLSAARTSVDPRHPRDNGASTARTPGTAGITRHGPPTALLLTQLALPELLFGLRFATGELLHHHHPAATRPPVHPITIVLDTTPPTYGPCESVLRLIAHLLTTTLWRYGHNPNLVTLTDPRSCVELSQTRDLLAIWTSRTLDPPDLTTALHTAATRTTHPTVTLTVHTSTDDHPSPSPAHQLVTTHHPTHPPDRHPSRPFHHHLDPDPTPSAIASIVDTLLASGE